MNRLILCLLAMSYLIGCAANPKLASTTVREGQQAIKLASLKRTSIALIPLRSVMGNPVKNNTVKNHFCRQLTQSFPQINLIKPGQLARLMFSNGREVASQYRQLLDKYFARGRFSKNDLAIFGSTDIDYIIAISLNGGFQNSFSYPRAYLFLMSLQIWDVHTGRMVWDIDQEGQVWIESEDENRLRRTELMRNLCNAVLAKLS